MATTAQNILTNMNSIALAVLGNTWQELRYVFTLEKNDLRGAYLAYGSRPLEAVASSTVTNSYMLSHRFELILCSTFTRDSSDSEKLSVLHTLYDKTDQIYRQYEALKLNLSSTVAAVSDPSISEPEILDAASLIVLRSQMSVRYRHTIP